MYFPYEIHIILGLQVMVLINLSQPFVLLTANMDDVKKLAKNFVSDSLAEQIADFIAKVSSSAMGTVVNVSEENEKNANLYQQVSDEEDSKNDVIIRQRNPSQHENNLKYSQFIKAKNKKHQQYKKPTDKYKSPNHMNYNKKHVPKQYKKRQGMNQQTNNYWPKSDQHRLSENQVNNINKNEYVNILLKEKIGYHQDISNTPEPSEDSLVTKKKAKQHRKPRKQHENEISKSFNQNPDESSGYAEKYEFDENPNPNRHRFAQVSSREFNETSNMKAFDGTTANESNTLTNEIKGSNTETAGNELTTKKERNEFDQYDNTQYPKSEFVATSGPVSLPKIPSQSKWSDKEMSEVEKSNEQSTQKKIWF